MSMMFENYGIKKKDVKYINHPNKNELTYKIKKNSVRKKQKLKMVG